MAKKQGRESPLFIRSAEKVFRVLELFGAQTPALTVSQVAQLADLDASSAQRCTHTLETLGMLKRVPETKAYALSPNALSFGQRYLSSVPLMEHAVPYAVDLNRKFEEMTSLSVLEGNSVIFILRLPGRQFLNAHITIGFHLPAFCTAPGLAILSRSPESMVEVVLKSSDQRKFTDETQTDPKAIRKRIKHIQEAGSVVTSEEYLIGDVSVAAPILGENGQALAAINVAMPTARWSKEQVEQNVAPAVRKTAAIVSHRFGYREN